MKADNLAMSREEAMEQDLLHAINAEKFGGHGPNRYIWSGSLNSMHELVTECIHPQEREQGRFFKTGLIVGRNFQVTDIREPDDGGMIVMDAYPTHSSYVQIRCWHPDDVKRISRYYRDGDIIDFDGIPDCLSDQIVI